MVNSFPTVNVPQIRRNSVAQALDYGINPVWNFTTNQIETSPDGRIIYTDGNLGLMQKVMKIMKTERGKYPIYPPTYGNDLHNLIGQDPEYVKIRIPRMITESLKSDPRIGNVSVTVSQSRSGSFDVEVLAQDAIAKTTEVINFRFSNEEGME